MKEFEVNKKIKMNPTSKKFKSIYPKRLHGVLVNDGDVNYAIKVWKRILKDSNVMGECYDRKYHKKPSQVRREQNQIAKYNQSRSTNA